MSMLVDNKGRISTDLYPGVYRIRGFQGSSHSYVIKGEHKTALIDSGAERNFPYLKEGLGEIGLAPEDVDILINTHEHSDHMGANRHFQETSLVAAYRLSASKMACGDSFVTFEKPASTSRVHLWLENMTRLDLGGYSLRAVHTPGHTSGSICLFEPEEGILFSGDTLFSGGVLSYIAESGSVGDYLDSLKRLSSFKIKQVFPGHGRVSSEPERDIARAVESAEALLRGDKNVRIRMVD